MSTSSQQDAHDPNSLLYYAPRRLRDRANALRGIRPQPANDVQPGAPAATGQQAGADGGMPDKPFPQSLRPPNESESTVPLGVLRPRRKKVFIVAGGVAAVAGIVSGAALIYFVNSAGSRDWGLSADVGTASSLSTQLAKKAAVEQLIQRMTVPTLAVEDGSGNINEPLSLGLQVAGHAQGETVNLSGLVVGTKLSTGATSGAGEWRLAVHDLPVTVVIPPRDYVGPMNIVAELPGEGGQTALRGAVRLAWKQDVARSGAAQQIQPTAANASSGANTAAVGSARQMDAKEIAGLIKRGEELASNGDMPAARLLLQRAAEARSARAAYGLAATYDPIVIKQLGFNNGTSDLAQAKAWYQRARDWGSPEAPKQLEALASAEPARRD